MRQSVAIILFFSVFTLSCANINQQQKNMETEKTTINIATFGTGCFWCSEAIFERVKGVVRVEAGYSGGDEPNPDYQLVSTGHTRYAEVVQIFYNPGEISFKELLEIFWKTHDPTMIDRQGTDIGPQYRSVIFYHNQKQKELSGHYKEVLEKAQIWTKPIVTEITPFKTFYKAEKQHQNYYNNNPAAGYCQFVITPKIEKFKKIFMGMLK